MKTDKQKIIDNYDNDYEDSRFSGSRADSLEAVYTKKVLDKYIKKTDRVAEIGCATGYYGFYLSDKCLSYTGVDLSANNIRIFNEKIKKSNMNNLYASVGDAMDLSNIENETFDVVLVFGPLYHLHEDDREAVLLESKRICKKGGNILLAYINKVGAYINGCIENPEIYPNEKTNKIVLTEGTDDIMPNIFFFTMPEDMVKLAEHCNLEVEKNIGVNFALGKSRVNGMPEEQYKLWLEILDLMFESPSCSGISSHTILVCRK